MASFIVPNAPIDAHKQLTDFQVTLEEVEKWTGYEFFPKLKLNKVYDLCQFDGCKMISQQLVELYNLSRSIKKAKCLDDLDKIWKTVQERDLKVDKQFMEEFTSKQKQLKGNS